MISLSQIQTSVLRQMTGADTMTRGQMITALNLKGIFAAHPDGTNAGHEEYIAGSVNEPTRELKDRSMEEPPVVSDEPMTQVMLPSSSLLTDVSYDVLVTDHMHVQQNIHFFKPGFTNIRDELLDNRALLNDIHKETTLFKSVLENYSVTFQTNELDVPVSNKLGTFHELHLSPSSVRYEKPIFKCTRVDEMVNLYIEFLITEIHTDIIEILLPYNMRAQYVPFRVILRPNDGSGEFSGMARAYGKNVNKLYVESYLFQDTFYISIEGNYLTTFDQPYMDKQIRWVTPAKFNHTKILHFNNVRLLTEVSGSDLGFNDGYAYETRTLNRVDLALRFVFSQRTSQHVPVMRFVAEFPVLNERVYGTRVKGYATCYLPEHRVFTTHPPIVTISEANQLDVFVKIGSLLFHDVVVQAHVSYYLTNDTIRVNHFEKPIIRADSSLALSQITISNLHMYDAMYNDTYRLFNRYNVILVQRNHVSDYDSYRPVPLQLMMRFDLNNHILEVSNIALFNQLDQFDRRYLYPRSKLFYIKLFVKNFVNEYDGPYDITPDYTQLIDLTSI